MKQIGQWFFNSKESKIADLKQPLTAINSIPEDDPEKIVVSEPPLTPEEIKARQRELTEIQDKILAAEGNRHFSRCLPNLPYFLGSLASIVSSGGAGYGIYILHGLGKAADDQVRQAVDAYYHQLFNNQTCSEIEGVSMAEYCAGSGYGALIYPLLKQVKAMANYAYESCAQIETEMCGISSYSYGELGLGFAAACFLLGGVVLFDYGSTRDRWLPVKGSDILNEREKQILRDLDINSDEKPLKVVEDIKEMQEKFKEDMDRLEKDSETLNLIEKGNDEKVSRGFR